MDFFNRINIYLFTQIYKYFFLILFIFLSIAWLLQITRLFTITNFMQIEVFNIIYLSLFLIPNIITVIIPFIIIFCLMLCFVKMYNDRELIAVVSLGLGLNPLKNTLILFGSITISLFTLLNFYLAPKIYETYKIKEFDLRNTIDFNTMTFSNFLNLDKSTILDFDKINDEYRNIFINYKEKEDDKENIIYAKKGNIFNEKNQYKFQLTDGFKITINNQNEIEKLEFLNYVLKIENNNINELKILDKNTLTIFDDLLSNNYLNIAFKLADIILILIIIIFFYQNNLRNINFSIRNNIFFITLSISILIINQIIKNSEILVFSYTTILFLLILFLFLITKLKNKYE